MSCVRVGTAMKAYRLKDLLRSWQTVQQSIAALGARQEFPVARSGSRLASTFAAPNGIAVGLRGLSATRSASDVVVEKHAALGRLAIGPAGSRLFSADGALHKDEESEKKPQDLGSKLEAGKVAGVTSYWGITPRTYFREDGTPWPWKDFQPGDAYVPDTTVDLSKHHKPQNWSDRIAYWTVKLLRVPTDIFFRKRYGCRAMMLETVAAVPGMVAGMLLHFKSLRRFERSGGWIKALLDEAENERMHLMTFMEVAQPKWYERALVLAVQGVFFNAYFLFYILSPTVAHRIVGYLEEEAIYSYTQFLKEIDNGHIENVPAPAIAIDYWKLHKDASLRDVVVVVRADEAHHRDVNHFASDVQKEGKDLKDVPAPIGYH